MVPNKMEINLENTNLDEMVVIEEGAEEQIEVESTEESEEEAEDVVSIDGESPPDQEDEQQQAPEWVRELRKKYRSTAEENRKLKAELEGKAAPVQTGTVLRKPTLEDYDYDTEEFEVAYDRWQTQKGEHDKAQLQQQQEATKVLENYAKAKQALKVKDYDIVEDVVVEKLPVELQNVILSIAENPATLVYALGKNKAKLEELSKITNPFMFAKEIGKLEGKLKVERRNLPPAPEKTVSGSATRTTGEDAHLDRLREEARKTGDMSKVMAYKQQMKGK